MPTDTLTEAEFEVARFLASGPTPQEIAAFHLSTTSAERFYALVETERAGQLSSDEQMELDAFMNVEHNTDERRVARHLFTHCHRN